MPLQPVKTHAQCVHAYGFCRPAPDGRPILCRCPHYPDRMMMCSAPACAEHFAFRTQPAPEKVTEQTSRNLHEDKVKEKVVPLFRPGESRPWKTVRASEIGPRGISWDGTPYQTAQEGPAKEAPNPFPSPESTR